MPPCSILLVRVSAFSPRATVLLRATRRLSVTAVWRQHLCTMSGDVMSGRRSAFKVAAGR
jgi:hypothetical protein